MKYTKKEGVMKNIYIVKSDEEFFVLEGSAVLDKWLIDGSLKKGDIVYTVKDEFKVTNKMLLTKKKSQ